MQELPKDLSVYFTTERFNADTVPDKLLRSHTLKRGVFGRIVVLKGEVEFWVAGEPPTMVRVLPGDATVRVLPEQTHWIAPKADAEFHIELLRSTG